MKLKTSLVGAALAAGLGLGGAAHANPPTPEMLSFACAGCHGVNGASAGPTMPTLASHSEEATVVAMRKFKSGERPSTVMGRIARGYTDADFEAMGYFFSKQKFHPVTQKIDAAKAKKGAEMAEQACSRCHLEDGRKGKGYTPVIASQWLEYLLMQAKLFDSGARKMSDEKAERWNKLSKKEREALLHFYAGVK